jgi:hypothetical protein
MGSSAEDLAEVLITKLADAAFTSANVKAGKKHLYENRTSPRIAVVPKGGPIGDTDRIGGGKTSPTERDKILHIRQVEFEIWCHGQSPEQAEDILNNTIIALHHYNTSARLGNEEWDPEHENGWLTDGTLVRFTVTLGIPVYAGPRTLTFLTADPPIDETDKWGDEEVSCQT